jgi:hypothetical protein
MLLSKQAARQVGRHAMTCGMIITIKSHKRKYGLRNAFSQQDQRLHRCLSFWSVCSFFGSLAAWPAVTMSA